MARCARNRIGEVALGPIRADRVAENPGAANSGIRLSAQACHVRRFLVIADKVADVTSPAPI